MPRIAPFVIVAVVGCGSPDTAPDAGRRCEAPGGLPVYLERTGGHFEPGLESPADNRSSLLVSAVDAPPYAIDDATWARVVACVADGLAPFDLRVTETDPGAVDQLEIVVLGALLPPLVEAPILIGWAPCSTFHPMIAFVGPYALTTPPDADAICRLVLKAVGTAGGLEATTDCADVMAEGPCAGVGAFSAAQVPCIGTACICPVRFATTQASYYGMATAYGTCP